MNLKFVHLGLMLAVVLLLISAGTPDQTLTEGNRVGYLAPRFELSNTDQRSMFETQEEGTYTVLSFWASYDAPSRVKNLKFLNQVKHYGDKIRMISVSLDDNKIIFEETTQRDGLSQIPHLMANSELRKKLIKDYDLKKNLKSFLIDSKGVIISANVTPEEIKEKLELS